MLKQAQTLLDAIGYVSESDWPEEVKKSTYRLLWELYETVSLEPLGLRWIDTANGRRLIRIRGDKWKNIIT